MTALVEPQEVALKTLTYKDRVVFQKLRVPGFKRLPKEYNENEACFVFVLRGAFAVRSQTKVLDLDRKTALLAKCLNYYYEPPSAQKGEGKEVEVLGVLLYPELVSDLFDLDLSTSEHRVDYDLKQVQVNRLLEIYRDSVNVLIDDPDLADPELIRNKLREFVILMTKTEGAPSVVDFLAAMFKPNFARFEEVIQSNIYADLSVNELATLCHMSLSTFKRKFTAAYGKSPARYFNQAKVNKALTLLKNPELRISDIAYDLGFDSLTTFNRVFKQETGKSPTAHRSS